ncbi:F0F1 ATP synthase subunit B [Mycobacterium sp. DL440]|uniref:F0F1 ATP synthase subunit B n=1 Tax=Mycobacterium sp. DL440 TaxID=2675523 RepID=UPI0014216FB6|nr:F0F1 ATP synthase subunit B [Mycobacterium sp. DL440]
MGELSATILAASQAAEEGGGGQSNFLVPNGTFFAVLIIFLITLGVIAKWVVPPVGKVLAEREAMLAKTTADNRKSAEQVAAAQADYDEAMAGARTQASAIRDEARAAGREVVDAKRAEANTEVAEAVSQADEQLAAQGAGVRSGLESSVDGLSQILADRILGIDVKSGGTQ